MAVGGRAQHDLHNLHHVLRYIHIRQNRTIRVHDGSLPVLTRCLHYCKQIYAPDS